MSVLGTPKYVFFTCTQYFVLLHKIIPFYIDEGHWGPLDFSLKFGKFFLHEIRCFVNTKKEFNQGKTILGRYPG